LIVVAIVIVMAAVALPNIGRYIRNYKIKGAAQMIGGELNAARSRAVMSNTNKGVSFVIVDRESFRFVQEDLDTANPERLSSMKKLPGGIVFLEQTALTSPGPTLRFQRLGGFCNPASACPPAVDEDQRTAPGEASLFDPTTANLQYIGDLGTGTMQVRIRETTTGLERTIQIAPGGRVLPQP
jgi:type II secretory pathway pseudopilin PulG